jgi:hypothetical protein
MLCIPDHYAEKNTQGKALQILRKHMNTLVQIWTVFILHNLVPTKHTSDVRIVYCHLIYCLMKKIRIDGAQVISNEMHAFVTKKEVAKASLGFPVLIIAMCMKAGVPNVNPTQEGNLIMCKSLQEGEHLEVMPNTKEQGIMQA